VYGSSVARALYGHGNYQARAAYAGGFTSAGGFFSGLKKLAGKAVSFATANPLGKALVGSIPGVGGALTAFDALKGIGAGANAGLNKTLTPFKPGLVSGGAAGGKLSLPAFGAAAARKVSSSRSRKKRTSSRPKKRTKRTSSRRRRRRAGAGDMFSAGDYGDDWKGSTPSRDKHGRYLTRAGGRRHHAAPPRRRRRRRGSRRPGQRVSFTTKDGRTVSFTAR
jgi:hypothetical protein